MKKQYEVTERTKQNIIYAFWQLYKTTNISQISISNIMKLAGYNRCTFYEYFKDINSLLNYIEDSIISFISSNIIPNINNLKLNNSLIDNITFLYQEKGEYISILLNKTGDSNFINKLKTTLKPVFYSNFSLSTNDNSELIFEYTISGLLNAFSYWYKNKDRLDINDVIQIVYALLSNGVISEVKKLQLKNNREISK